MTEASNSLRPYRAGFFFSFFNAPAFFIGLGTPLVLLAETLGATTTQVGVMYSFIFLLLPVQVLATVGLPVFGYKKQVLTAWGVRCFGLLVPLALSILSPATYRQDLVYWLMGGVFFFCFFRAVGTCGVQPWLFELIPERLQNRYFSTDMMVIGFAGTLSLVFSGVVFSTMDGFGGFAIQYAVALTGGVVALVALARLPSVPKPEPYQPFRLFTDAPKILGEKGDYRRYLIITIIWATTSCGVVPFGAYYLRTEIGLTRDVILLFTAMASVGGISGAWFFRDRLDKIGVRNAFYIVVGLHATVFMIWAVFILGEHLFGIQYGLWIFGLASAYALLGVAGSCYLVSHLKYLAFISSGKDRALRVSLQTSTVGLMTGLAAILWGGVFRGAGAQPGMNVNAFLVYLLSITVIQIGLIPILRRLEEPSGTFKPLFNPRGIARPFRFIATMPVVPFRGREAEDRRQEPES